MSAYLVSHDHINALATFAQLHNVYINHWAIHWHGKDHAKEIAEALRAANVASMTDRYNDSEPEPYTFKPYRNVKALTPVQIMKACICFDYQACEVPNYETTLAAAITAAILAQAAREMPGYQEADWDMPDDAPPPMTLIHNRMIQKPLSADEMTARLIADLTAPPKTKPAPKPAEPARKAPPGDDEPF